MGRFYALWNTMRCYVWMKGRQVSYDRERLSILYSVRGSRYVHSPRRHGNEGTRRGSTLWTAETVWERYTIYPLVFMMTA